MTKSRLFLRIGIVCLVATFVLSLALSHFNADLLPVELRDWDQGAGEPSRLAVFIASAFQVSCMVVYAASLTGLFCYRRWAAWLLLVFTAVFSLFELLAPSVEPGITAFVGEWDSLLTGAVLALAFFTDALEPGRD